MHEALSWWVVLFSVRNDGALSACQILFTVCNMPRQRTSENFTTSDKVFINLLVSKLSLKYLRDRSNMLTIGVARGGERTGLILWNCRESLDPGTGRINRGFMICRVIFSLHSNNSRHIFNATVQHPQTDKCRTVSPLASQNIYNYINYVLFATYWIMHRANIKTVHVLVLHVVLYYSRTGYAPCDTPPNSHEDNHFPAQDLGLESWVLHRLGCGCWSRHQPCGKDYCCVWIYGSEQGRTYKPYLSLSAVETARESVSGGSRHFASQLSGS